MLPATCREMMPKPALVDHRLDVREGHVVRRLEQSNDVSHRADTVELDEEEGPCAAEGVVGSSQDLGLRALDVLLEHVRRGKVGPRAECRAGDIGRSGCVREAPRSFDPRPAHRRSPTRACPTSTGCRRLGTRRCRRGRRAAAGTTTLDSRIPPSCRFSCRISTFSSQGSNDTTRAGEPSEWRKRV